MKIHDLPRHERPREKMIERGAQGLKDKELLAILLRTGNGGKNAIELAQEILHKYPMRKLMSFGVNDFMSVKGIDQGKACTLLASFELTRRALDVEDNNLPTINSARDAAAHLQDIRSAKKEHFVVLYLNARNQLIHKEVISVGTLNANLVHPREVFKPAVDHLAASLIVAHNHPSGDPEASEADLELTDRLKQAGRTLGIELTDHLVVTADKCKSIY
jgi:DNA repair protein RadC